MQPLKQSLEEDPKIVTSVSSTLPSLTWFVQREREKRKKRIVSAVMSIGMFQMGEEAEYDTSNHKIPQIIKSDMDWFTGFKTIVISGTQKACKPPQPPKNRTDSISYQPSFPSFSFSLSQKPLKILPQILHPSPSNGMKKARPGRNRGRAYFKSMTQNDGWNPCTFNCRQGKGTAVLLHNHGIQSWSLAD